MDSQPQYMNYMNNGQDQTMQSQYGQGMMMMDGYGISTNDRQNCSQDDPNGRTVTNDKRRLLKRQNASDEFD